MESIQSFFRGSPETTGNFSSEETPPPKKKSQKQHPTTPPRKKGGYFEDLTKTARKC